MDEEVALSILEEDNDEYAVAEDEIITGNGRWHIHYEMVVQHKVTLEYFKIMYSRGSTEYQDNGVENVYAIKVKPEERTTIAWVPA